MPAAATPGKVSRLSEDGFQPITSAERKMERKRQKERETETKKDGGKGPGRDFVIDGCCAMSSLLAWRKVPWHRVGVCRFALDGKPPLSKKVEDLPHVVRKLSATVGDVALWH